MSIGHKNKNYLRDKQTNNKLDLTFFFFFVISRGAKIED